MSEEMMFRPQEEPQETPEEAAVAPQKREMDDIDRELLAIKAKGKKGDVIASPTKAAQPHAIERGRYSEAKIILRRIDELKHLITSKNEEIDGRTMHMTTRDRMEKEIVEHEEELKELEGIANLAPLDRETIFGTEEKTASTRQEVAELISEEPLQHHHTPPDLTHEAGLTPEQLRLNDLDDDEDTEAPTEIILDELKLIGKGGVSEVYRGLEVRTGKTYIKKVAKNTNLNRFIEREAEVRRARGMKISEGKEDQKAFIIYEMPLEYKPAQEVVQNLTPRQKYDVIIQAAEELKQIHDAGFLHNDLSLDTVFIKRDEEGNVSTLLSDYTHAVPITEAEELAAEVFNHSLQTMSSVDMGIGKLPYVTPDRKNGLYKDAQAEVQAFAYIAYEIIFGHIPEYLEDWEALDELDIEFGHLKEMIRIGGKRRIDRYANMDEFLSQIVSPKVLNALRTIKLGEEDSQEKQVRVNAGKKISWENACDTLVENGHPYSIQALNKALEKVASNRYVVSLKLALIRLGAQVPDTNSKFLQDEVLTRLTYIQKNSWSLEVSEQERAEMIDELSAYISEQSSLPILIRAVSVALDLFRNRKERPEVYHKALKRLHKTASDIRVGNEWKQVWKQHFSSYKFGSGSFVFEENRRAEANLFCRMIDSGVSLDGKEKYYIEKYKDEIYDALNMAPSEGVNYTWEEILDWIPKYSLRDRYIMELNRQDASGVSLRKEMEKWNSGLLLQLLEAEIHPCSPHDEELVKKFIDRLSFRDLSEEERSAFIHCLIDVFHVKGDYHEDVKRSLCVRMRYPQVRKIIMEKIPQMNQGYAQLELTKLLIDQWKEYLEGPAHKLMRESVHHSELLQLIGLVSKHHESLHTDVLKIVTAHCVDLDESQSLQILRYAREHLTLSYEVFQNTVLPPAKDMIGVMNTTLLKSTKRSLSWNRLSTLNWGTCIRHIPIVNENLHFSDITLMIEQLTVFLRVYEGIHPQAVFHTPSDTRQVVPQYYAFLEKLEMPGEYHPQLYDFCLKVVSFLDSARSSFFNLLSVPSIRGYVTRWHDVFEQDVMIEEAYALSNTEDIHNTIRLSSQKQLEDLGLNMSDIDLNNVMMVLFGTLISPSYNSLEDLNAQRQMLRQYLSDTAHQLDTPLRKEIDQKIEKIEQIFRRSINRSSKRRNIGFKGIQN